MKAYIKVTYGGLVFALAAWIMVHGVDAASYTWTGTAGDNLWVTPNNWGGTVPTSTDIANIGNTSSTRTILYTTSTASTTLASTLNLAQTTSGVSNIFKITGSSSTTGTYTMTVTNDVTLGTVGGDSTAVSEIIVDASLNQTSAAGSQVNLQLGSGSGKLTLNSGGYLQLNNYFYGSSLYAGNFRGAVVINSGGKLVSSLVLGSSNTLTAGSSIQNIISSYVELHAGGELTVDNGVAANTNGSSYDIENRLQINGNFTMDGGTLTFGGSKTQLILNGATNEISGGTITGSSFGTISLGSGSSQTLSLNQSIYTLVTRSTSSANVTKTVTMTNPSATIGTIKFGSSSNGYATTFKLGSDITASTIQQGYGAGASTTIGSIIDLNSNDLTLTNTGAFAPGNISGSSVVNWYITNTGSQKSYIIADSYNFAPAGQVNVGYGEGTVSSTLTLGTIDSGSTGEVVLIANGTNANNLGGGGTISANSKFWYKGSGATLTSNRAIGKLEVGDGFGGMLTLASNITTKGDVKVNNNSSLNLYNYTLTLTGSANLSGIGRYISTGTSAKIIFDPNVATGGISPGGAMDGNEHGIGSVGKLYINENGMASTSHVTSVELTSTSNSYIDIASATSYDVIDLGGASIVYDGVLHVSYMSGYFGNVGESYNIVLNSGSYSGSFDSIVGDNGYTFSYDYATGVLMLTAIPEPSTVTLLVIALLIAGILHIYYQNSRRAVF